MFTKQRCKEYIIWGTASTKF